MGKYYDRVCLFVCLLGFMVYQPLYAIYAKDSSISNNSVIISTQFTAIWSIDRALFRATSSRLESTWKQWQWRGAPHSPNLQHHWNFTIRLFSVILVGMVLPLRKIELVFLHNIMALWVPLVNIRVLWVNIMAYWIFWINIRTELVLWKNIMTLRILWVNIWTDSI